MIHLLCFSCKIYLNRKINSASVVVCALNFIIFSMCNMSNKLDLSVSFQPTDHLAQLQSIRIDECRIAFLFEFGSASTVSHKLLSFIRFADSH